ncbi:MAG: CopD family protein [Gammaproteobacteria bacterium]|nr:CopD family protein [Gammaproteobacteria bacterium]
MSIAISLHLLAVIIWVGGMFFAHQALRPVAASLLEPDKRLPLWSGVFARFFPWVWLAIIILLISGFWMTFELYGSIASSRSNIHIMMGLGSIMVIIFMYVFFMPYKQLNQFIGKNDFPSAAGQLAKIRKAVGLNLILGLIVSIVAAGGRYW